MSRFTWLSAISAFVLAGCATSQTLVNHQPDWWGNPQQHGHEYLYFKAMGESAVSMEDARQQAMRSVQRQVVEYILAEVSLSGPDRVNQSYFESLVPLSEVQTMGHPEDARIGGKWFVWMLGRYPVAEYEQIRRRVETGRELDRLRADALSSMNRQDYDSAESLMLKVVDEYPMALRVSFPVESIKLDLANLYLRQGRNLQARQWTMDVKSGSTDSIWLKKASDLLPTIPEVNLKDAFDGKIIGIVCLRGDEAGFALDSELTTNLRNRISALGVALKNVELLLPQYVGHVDIAYMKDISSALSSAGVDALIVVQLTTDKAKTGKQQEVFGVVKDVIDSEMNYWVVRVRDGQVLAADQTVGYSKNVDAMLQVVLSHRRHLPLHAATIASALLNAE